MAPLMRSILLFFVFLHETFCQCPPGYSTLFNNNQLVTCSPQNPCSCASIAAGYFCQYSSQNSQYVCCGVSSSQCPSSSAQMNNGVIQNCQSSNDCSSGYYCNQNTCCASPSAQCGGSGGSLQCANGQVLVNGVCVNQIGIGSFCQSSAVCTGGAQCLNNFCQCANGKQNVGGQCQGNGNNGGQCGQGSVLVNNQCLPRVSPGQSCTSTAQCLDNSICSNVGTGMTCNCQNNQQQINGYCVPAPTGSCQASQVLINGICQTFSTLNGPCVGNAQCVGGSSCNNNFCSCSGNTQSVTLTSNGISRGYCLSNSNNNNFCQSGQVLVNGQCMNTVNLGQLCSNSLQCTTSLAQCTNGRCQCQMGTVQQNGLCIQGGTGVSCQLGSVMVNGVCTQMSVPGAQCFSQNQCLDNAICNNNGGMSGQCVCSNNGQIISGYCMPQTNGICSVTQTYINGQCLTYSTVGGSCQADQQCIGGSNCIQNTCQCTQNKQRFCTAQNGFQSCYCISPSSTGTSCQSGQVLVNGQCMNTVNVGMFGCSNTLQCLGNSQCTNGQCQCPSGTIQQNGQCISTGVGTSQSPPGSFCSSSSSCLDGSTCTFNNCTCQNGGQAVYGYCLPPKTDFCTTTQVMMSGQCVTYSVIGGSCLGDKQCLGGSFCNGGTCQCRSGVQQTCIGFNQCYCQGGNSGTIPIGGFGCSSSQMCLGNAQCSNGQCLCGFGQVQQGNQCVTGNGGSCQSYQIQFNGQCLDTVSIGQQCTNQVQCQIPNAICSGTCTCSSGFTYDGTGCIMSSTFCPQGTVSVSNTCRSLVSLGQFCQTSAQCLGFGVCGSNQFCACPTGTTNINNVCRNTGGSGQCNVNQVLIGNQCYNKVALGQSCMASAQCPQNAQCFNSICTCPSGTTDYGNGICTGGSSDSDLCSAGETPQYSNNQLINCLTSACPSASYCKYNSRYSKYVCCRPQTSTLTCANPAFSVVYQNGSPLNCLLSQCPTNSICEYNNSSGQYVCCQAGNSNPPSSTCTGNYYTYSNGFPFVCTSDSSCASTSSNYRYCRQAPGQTFSVCCDRS